MTDPDDLRRLAAVVEAIEDAGGEVENVDVETRAKNLGIAETMNAALGGKVPVEPVFEVRIAAGAVEIEDTDLNDVAESGFADEATDAVFENDADEREGSDA